MASGLAAYASQYRDSSRSPYHTIPAKAFTSLSTGSSLYCGPKARSEPLVSLFFLCCVGPRMGLAGNKRIVRLVGKSGRERNTAIVPLKPDRSKTAVLAMASVVNQSGHQSEDAEDEEEWLG